MGFPHSHHLLETTAHRTSGSGNIHRASLDQRTRIPARHHRQVPSPFPLRNHRQQIGLGLSCHFPGFSVGAKIIQIGVQWVNQRLHKGPRHGGWAVIQSLGNRKSRRPVTRSLREGASQFSLLPGERFASHKGIVRGQ